MGSAGGTGAAKGPQKCPFRNGCTASGAKPASVLLKSREEPLDCRIHVGCMYLYFQQLLSWNGHEDGCTPSEVLAQGFLSDQCEHRLLAAFNHVFGLGIS